MPRPFPTPTPDRPAPWSRREDGSMTIFAVFVFVAMLMVAGIAIDMMRVEHERVRMQGATDRAVLAATMLRENISGATPQQLAESFLRAEGLEGHLQGRVLVEDIGDGRRVTLTPGGVMPTGFMRLLGIDDIPVVTRAQAVEAVTETRFEIVMVLDISGSMNSHNRIANLRTAAAELIETLLRDTQPGDVALTIVPYETHVVPPPGLASHFVNLPLSGGACIDFLNWNSVTNSLLAPVIRRGCAANAARAVRPYLYDADEAIAFVNGLMAGGTTSIDLGVRFGALFFDETINPAIEQMVANGEVHPAFADRPFRSNEPGVVRAMIVMTDGQNCCFGGGGRNPTAMVQDTNTLQSCAATRAEGVTIYSVAFEAPSAGVALMQGCASSENHFFNTSGAGIIDAFAAVATHIQSQALRLTQ